MTIACVGAGVSGMAMWAASVQGLLPSKCHLVPQEHDESALVCKQGCSLTMQQGKEFLQKLGVEEQCQHCASNHVETLASHLFSACANSLKQNKAMRPNDTQTLETLAFEIINGATGETPFAGGRPRGTVPSARQ